MIEAFYFNGEKMRVWLSRNGYPCISQGKHLTYLHRLVWEIHNGQIPEGYQIHHIDHDKKNWQIENLMMVDRKSHWEIHKVARRNQKPCNQHHV